MTGSVTSEHAPSSVLDLQHHTTPMLGNEDSWRVKVVDRDYDPFAIGPRPCRRVTPVRVRSTDPRLLLDAIRPRDLDMLSHGDDLPRNVTATLLNLRLAGTPVQFAVGPALAAFETRLQLAFDVARTSWVAVGTPLRAHVDAQPRSSAFRAFKELAVWLNRTERETAQLVGVGRTTPYTWERDGREPRPRSARRLYETHAFVRQLVLSMGKQDAESALGRGGGDSALTLIASNRVAEAEARFASVIYGRPSEELPPLGASRDGDNDTVDSEPLPDRRPGGRRPVQVRRGR